jgi:hypothetical protein
MGFKRLSFVFLFYTFLFSSFAGGEIQSHGHSITNLSQSVASDLPLVSAALAFLSYQVFLSNLSLFFALFFIQWFSFYVLLYDVLNTPLSLVYYPLMIAGICSYVRFFISLLPLFSRIPSFRDPFNLSSPLLKK